MKKNKITLDELIFLIQKESDKNFTINKKTFQFLKNKDWQMYIAGDWEIKCIYLKNINLNIKKNIKNIYVN